MTPFFTIIVSCCDVAPYLRECLYSVANQPFKDWECLLGVEESKDDTEKIAREYAAKDPRFKVFTGPRSGSCSVSRNTGVDMAQLVMVTWVSLMRLPILIMPVKSGLTGLGWV